MDRFTSRSRVAEDPYSAAFADGAARVNLPAAQEVVMEVQHVYPSQASLPPVPLAG